MCHTAKDYYGNTYCVHDDRVEPPYLGPEEEQPFLGDPKQGKDSPIWRVTKDRQHISFYGNPSSCEGSTPWCKTHCYLRLVPAEALKEVTPVYDIADFTPPVAEYMREDFTAAKYVTMFASGSIENTVTSPFLHDSEPQPVSIGHIIRTLSSVHPGKIFRFFLRTKIDKEYLRNPCRPTEKNFKPNVRILFSADVGTGTELIDWAFESTVVSAIAVVNHPDNRSVIDYIDGLQTLKHKGQTPGFPVIDCATCNGDYKCFNSTEKSLLLLDWIGEEE